MPKKLSSAAYKRGTRTIWRYVKPYRKELLAIILLSLISAAGDALVPFLSGKIFDAVLGKLSPYHFLSYTLNSFVVIISAWFLARIATDTADRIQGVRQEAMGAAVEADYMVGAFSRVLRFPLSFHKQHRLGEISNRIDRGSNWLQGILNRVIIDLAPQFFSLAIGVIIVFFIKPILAVILLIAVLIYALILMRTAPRLTVFSHKMNKSYSKAYGELYDTMWNYQAVKQAAAEGFEEKRLHRIFRLRATRLWTDYIRIGANLSFAQRILVTVTQLSIFSFSVYLIQNGQLTPGEMVAFNGYAALLFGPFVVLGRNWETIQNGLVAIERSEEILRKPTEDYNPEGGEDLPDVNGEVEFENVSFKYANRQKMVLKNVSFKVKPGQSIALVGESDVGKTTLADMISYYLKPVSGRILIDGKDVSKLNLVSLRSFIAVVPQEPVLFNETVGNNIRYGKFDATDAEVKEAARLAHADDFISKFSKKYEQLVGERGVKLSTGQKQRIAIARAILRDPKILILDEPTSALDAKSEKYISESLIDLMRGRTTFIIAHRLSTVRRADKILAIKDGRIVESGSHDELLLIPDGVYRKLHDLQLGLK